jgi:hypothetical protein
VEQIELMGAFLDGALDGEAHGDEADTQPRKTRIETGLIEGKDGAVAEAVEGRTRTSTQPENKQPEPAAIQGETGDIVVEFSNPGPHQAVPAARLPPKPMQLKENRENLAPPRFGGNTLEPEAVFGLEPPKPPLEVVPML